MDRLLKPGKLEVLPEEPDSTKIFDYWQKTFDVLTEVLEKADDADSVNKLGLLTNYLTHKMYAFVTDTRSYDEARQQFSILYPRNRDLHIFNLSKIQIFFSIQKILIQLVTAQSYFSFGTFANQSYLFFGTFGNAIYEIDWFVYQLKKSLKNKLCHEN